MNAAGEARDALVRLQNTVHKHWTSGDAHAVLCSWGKKIRDKFATDNTPVFLGGAPELRPVVELLQSMKRQRQHLMADPAVEEAEAAVEAQAEVQEEQQP
jgi:hypothetical protein